jgi:excisionase family DNA binding protein
MKLTPKQAAARAVVSLSLIYQWCQDGVLVHYRFGRPGKRGRIRIEDSDPEAFLATCKKEGEPQAATPFASSTSGSGDRFPAATRFTAAYPLGQR